MAELPPARDIFSDLGVSPTATADELREAYQRAVQQQALALPAPQFDGLLPQPANVTIGGEIPLPAPLGRMGKITAEPGVFVRPRKLTKPVPKCINCGSADAVTLFSAQSATFYKYTCGNPQCVEVPEEGGEPQPIQWRQIPVYKLQPGEDPRVERTYGQVNYKLAGTEKKPFGYNCGRCGQIKKGHTCSNPDPTKSKKRPLVVQEKAASILPPLPMPVSSTPKTPSCPSCHGPFCVIQTVPFLKFRCTSATRLRHSQMQEEQARLLQSHLGIGTLDALALTDGYTSDALAELDAIGEAPICDFCDEPGDEDDALNRLSFCICKRAAHVRCIYGKDGATYKCADCYCAICFQQLSDDTVTCSNSCGRIVHKTCISCDSDDWKCAACTLPGDFMM